MTSDPAVVFLFPGQGSQQQRMAAGLYGHDAVFTESIDSLFEAMGQEGVALRSDWLSATPRVTVDHVTRSTPLLFAVGYALAATVSSWGIRPDALLGHSIGEVAAATYAGVFDPAEAARLVRDRVRLLAQAPPGGMLAVAASAATVQRYVDQDVVIAAVNSPTQTVISGLNGPIEAMTVRLRADGIVCQRVPALSPFHSPAMAYLADTERASYEGVTLRPPTIPVHSAYVGDVLSATTATDIEFWISHPSAPVLFWPALDQLLHISRCILIELGPGEGLITLARRHRSVASGESRVYPALPFRAGSRSADREAMQTLHDALTTAAAA